MTYEQQLNRYLNDPLFHNVVDMLFAFLLEGNITIGELRDAATFAGIKFEHQKINPYISRDKE